MAFEICMHGLFRPEVDKFNICHISDAKKDYLPFNFQPEYLEARYQGKIWKWSQNNKAKFIVKEVEMEKTTKETLWNAATEMQSTVIVCGMHGRKGPKADLTVAGTATKYLYEKGLPLVIAKDPRRRGEDLKGSYRFGVCFDGSEQSVRALQTVMTMAADHDNITVITVKEPAVDNEKTTTLIAQTAASRKHDVVQIEREVNHTIY